MTRRSLLALFANTAVSPGGPSSRFPSLRYAHGRLALSWLSQQPDGARSFVCSLREPNGDWTPPLTITNSPRLMINWADFPTVLPLSNGSLVAHWLERDSAPGAYGIRIAFRSPGANQEWRTSYSSPPSDQGYEGFVSLLENRTGARAGVWASYLDHRSPKTALRALRFSPDGSRLENTTVDPDVCSCCQTSLIDTDRNELLLAYRGHTSSEIRDILLATHSGRSWNPQPRSVFPDHWRINACPVNGPALDRHGSLIAFAWYTAEPNPRVLATLSADSGRTFSKPVRLDTGAHTLGRVAVAAVSPTTAAIAFLEQGSVRLRYLSLDGTLSPAQDLDSVSTSRSSGFPRLAATPDGLFAAWTTSTQGIQIRSLPVSKLL